MLTFSAVWMDHGPRRARSPLPRPPRRARPRAPARLGLHLHGGADLAPDGAPSPVLRHAGRRASALGPGGRARRGAAEPQGQRHDLRCRTEPAGVRARDIVGGAHRPAWRANGARLALRGPRAEQPQRPRGALIGGDLLHRPVVRPHAGVRDRASARPRLPGRLPHPAGRRRAAAPRRPLHVRAAERPHLLPRRGQALCQRCS